MSYTVFVPGKPSHLCIGLESLSSPAAQQPICLECEDPGADNNPRLHFADSEVTCEMCNRSSPLLDFSSAFSEDFFDSESPDWLDASEMPTLSRHFRIDPEVCPLCNQAFNFSDLSDVPSPYNEYLSRFFDYANGRITCEEYLTFGQKSDHESDNESEHESRPSSQHMTIPETRDNSLVATR
jgi:hypothetical protein